MTAPTVAKTRGATASHLDVTLLGTRVPVASPLHRVSSMTWPYASHLPPSPPRGARAHAVLRGAGSGGRARAQRPGQERATNREPDVLRQTEVVRILAGGNRIGDAGNRLWHAHWRRDRRRQWGSDRRRDRQHDKRCPMGTGGGAAAGTIDDATRWREQAQKPRGRV